MGYSSHTGNINVDASVNSAEGQRQVSVAAAGSSQPTVNAAEITFYRSAMATLKAAGLDFTHCTRALMQLGTGGS